MKYNFNEIGKRITKERKAAGFKSQDSFIEYLRNEYGYSLSRNTLSAIENGKTNHYDADLLFAMCEIFDCEIGYLLGEYECKSGRVTDIVRETGLSETAVNKILQMNFVNEATEKISAFSLLITDKNFEYLIALMMDDSSGKTDGIAYRDVFIKNEKSAIISLELQSVVQKIAERIRKNLIRDPHAPLFKIAFGLYFDGRMDRSALEDVLREFRKGNWDYDLRLVDKKYLHNQPSLDSQNDSQTH